jgi:predicted SAM-dependent methyltransferase
VSHETSKALRRRMRDPNFATKYFVGKAIDIGSGSDPLSRQLGYWPLLESVDEWDQADGDAQYLVGVADNSYSLVLSSHCLEHVRDVRVALQNWWRVLDRGGHMVVTVPDFDMYERGHWPSRFNPDHKQGFTFNDIASAIRDDLRAWTPDVIKIERITEHFDPSLPDSVDQTQGLAECAIEFIVRKPA